MVALRKIRYLYITTRPFLKTTFFGGFEFLLLTSNPKPMNHETKAKLKAALVTGYILLATMTGIAFFGRFIFALITN